MAQPRCITSDLSDEEKLKLFNALEQEMKEHMDGLYEGDIDDVETRTYEYLIEMFFGPDVWDTLNAEIFV